MEKMKMSEIVRTSEISNIDDIIDSRDVIARIEELEFRVADPDAEDIDEEEREELRILKELQDEAQGSPDWQYGESLIRDSYFKEYAQKLAEDIGDVDPNAGWPNNCIDWDMACDALKQDYFSVDFDGIDYWIRA